MRAGGTQAPKATCCPEQGASPLAQKPAGISPLGERASQSQVTGSLVFRKLRRSFSRLRAHPVHRPLCVHTHSARPVSPECAEFLEGRGWGLGPMKVSAEAGQEHGPITLQHAPRHGQEPRREGSGARPPLRPVPWTSGPEETRPQNLRLHSKQDSKIGNGPFRTREEQLPMVSRAALRRAWNRARGQPGGSRSPPEARSLVLHVTLHHPEQTPGACLPGFHRSQTQPRKGNGG